MVVLAEALADGETDAPGEVPVPLLVPPLVAALGDVVATDAVGAFDTVADAVALLVALGKTEDGLGLAALFWFAQPASITPTAKTITSIKNIIFFKI